MNGLLESPSLKPILILIWKINSAIFCIEILTYLWWDIILAWNLIVYLEVLNRFWDNELITVFHVIGGLFNTAVIPHLLILKSSFTPDQVVILIHDEVWVGEHLSLFQDLQFEIICSVIADLVAKDIYVIHCLDSALSEVLVEVLFLFKRVIQLWLIKFCLFAQLFALNQRLVLHHVRGANFIWSLLSFCHALRHLIGEIEGNWCVVANFIDDFLCVICRLLNALLDSFGSWFLDDFLDLLSLLFCLGSLLLIIKFVFLLEGLVGEDLFSSGLSWEITWFHVFCLFSLLGEMYSLKMIQK